MSISNKKNRFRKCPLCSGSKKMVSVESINTQDISIQYKKMFDINTKPYFVGVREIELIKCHECDILFYSPIVSGDDAFYQELQKNPWYYQKTKEEYRYAKKFINEKDNVLEIGSGEGFFSTFLKNVSYVGLEMNSKAIQLAKISKLDVRAELIEEHFEKHGDYYDVVCSFQVLEHIENLSTFISSCLKVLKPGGLFIISVPSNDSFVGVVKNNILNMPPHHLTRWSDKSLVSIAQLYELDVVELYHNELDEIHTRWYANTLGLSIIEKILKISLKESLARSFIDRIISRLAIFLGGFIVLGLNDKKMKPNGHSVTVVYRKH